MAIGLTALPQLAKDIYDWVKFSGILAVAVGFIAGLFLGQRAGWIAGLTCTIVFPLTVITRRGAEKVGSETKKAIDQLSQTNVLTNDQRQQIIRQLDSLNRLLKWSAIISTIAVTTLTISFVYKLAEQWISTAKLNNIRFKDADYYNPAQDESWIGKYPFFEAIIGHLSAEARSENKRYRLLVAESEPFAHPAIKCQVDVRFDEAAFEMTGFAFLRRNTSAGLHLESIPVSYTTNHIMTITLPHAGQGDQLILILRLGRSDNELFPPHPSNLIKSQVVN